MEEHIRGVERGDKNDNTSARFHGLRGQKSKVRLRVGDLHLPERRHTGSRVEEVAGEQNCLCGTAIESRTNLVADCDLYKEEQHAEGGKVWALNKGFMKSCGTLDSIEKLVATV